MTKTIIKEKDGVQLVELTLGTRIEYAVYKNNVLYSSSSIYEVEEMTFCKVVDEVNKSKLTAEEYKKYTEKTDQENKQKIIDDIVNTPNGRLDPKGVNFITLKEYLKHQEEEMARKQKFNTVIEFNGRLFAVYEFDGEPVHYPLPQTEAKPTTERGKLTLANKYRRKARIEFDNGGIRDSLKNFSKGATPNERRSKK